MSCNGGALPAGERLWDGLPRRGGLPGAHTPCPPAPAGRGYSCQAHGCARTHRSSGWRLAVADRCRPLPTAANRCQPLLLVLRRLLWLRMRKRAGKALLGKAQRVTHG